MLELDLAAARTDERHDLTARELLVLDRPDAFSFRVGVLAADLVPALEGLRFQAPDGETIPSVWVSNAASAGIGRLLVVD